MYVDNNPPPIGLRIPKGLLVTFGTIAVFGGGAWCGMQLSKNHQFEEVARLTDNNKLLVATKDKLERDRNQVSDRLTKRETQIRNFQTCLKQSGILDEGSK